jgi:hypothetical protein
MNELERIEREIRNLAANVQNDVQNRRRHPTYGYRKADIRADYCRLEGMLMAWMLITRTWEHGTMPRFGPAELVAVKTALGVDLPMLHAAVASS